MAQPGGVTNQLKAAERPVLSAEDSAMLAPFAQGALSEGDKAWNEVQKLLEPPTPPLSWMTNEPSKEDIARFQNESGRQAGLAADQMKDFYTRFPSHAKAGDARAQELALLGAAVHLGQTNRANALRELEEGRLKDPNLTEDQRLELRFSQLQRKVSGQDNEDPRLALAELDAGVRELLKEFPDRPEVQQLQLTAAQAWLSQGEAEKAGTLVRTLTTGSADEELKAAARDVIKKTERVGKPFELKFTALDGREVDLQKLKGKVVLVDFWATWCRPCLQELPNVKAAYEKLHPKGFEIVGISFDDDKAALERLLAAEKMAWPQWFDAEDAGKKWGDEFGITGIPTMWLVDKKGILRELNAREDLLAKAEKLLAEP